MRFVTRMITAMLVVFGAMSSGYALQSATDLFERAQKDSLMYRRVVLYTEALALDGDLTDALRERGILYYYQRKLQEAYDDLTASVEKGGHDVRALLFRALVSLAREDWANALGDLNRAHLMAPKRSDILSHRAVVLYKLGRIAEAEKDATAVLSLQDDPAAVGRALTVRGDIYADRGNDLLAREAYRRAASGDPGLGFFYTWADVLSPEQAGRIGLWGLIVLSAIVIFRISLPKPKRKDSRPL